MKGTCHHKVLFERVVIILDNMQTFGAMAACFQICQPPKPQIGNFCRVPEFNVKL